MSAAALIAIDWGTTSARAYRLDGSGQVAGERSAALGIQQVRDAAYAPALAALLGDWYREPLPRLACGMIGSRQGWIEAPYVECPAALSALATALARTPGGELAIVPGVSCADAAGMPDVMRGEETQILGVVAAAADDRAQSRVIVLPGTHSKWAIVGDGRIETFATFLTGELFAVLKEHSILGRMMPPGAAPAPAGAAFDRGVQRGLVDGTDDAGLLHDLFGARTLALFGRLAPEDTGDYLSGLLIGRELRDGRAWAARRGADTSRVTLVAAAALAERYERAFGRAGANVTTAAADAAAHGLWRIALAAGVVR